MKKYNCYEGLIIIKKIFKSNVHLQVHLLSGKNNLVEQHLKVIISCES